MRQSEEIYRQRRDSFQGEERRLARISLRFSIARGALFLGFAGCLLWVLANAGDPPDAAWIGATAGPPHGTGGLPDLSGASGSGPPSS